MNIHDVCGSCWVTRCGGKIHDVIDEVTEVACIASVQRRQQLDMHLERHEPILVTPAANIDIMYNALAEVVQVIFALVDCPCEISLSAGCHYVVQTAGRRRHRCRHGHGHDDDTQLGYVHSGTHTQVHNLRYTLSGTHTQVHTQVHLVQLDWHTSWTFKKGLGTSKLAELKGLSSFEYKFFWVWVNAGN